MEGSASCESVVAALNSRGWRFAEENEEIRALIRSRPNSESVESELLNMDMRSFGRKMLPDPSSLKKLNHLTGPMVLQIVSTRDIHHSSIDASFKTMYYDRRLLRFCLTDGHLEVIAIEYALISTINEELIPGTKIRMEKRIPVHSGILCLEPDSILVMGGLVQSLHDEWQISRKYSGFSRSSLKLSQADDGTGPPPFEKLQISEYGRRSAQPHKLHVSDERQRHGNLSRQTDRRDLSHAEIDKMVKNPETDGTENKPSSSETRPKEVSEAVPVQNQAAAQKLLQKMSQPDNKEMNPRFRKHKFRAKQEEAVVFTLDEWERTKGTKLNPMLNSGMQDTIHDEELARQLQDQLDFEDSYAKAGDSEAEQIRRSLFNFSGAEDRSDGRREFRGQGRGRGRGRGRGKGRRFD